MKWRDRRRPIDSWGATIWWCLAMVLVTVSIHIAMTRGLHS